MERIVSENEYKSSRCLNLADENFYVKLFPPINVIISGSLFIKLHVDNVNINEIL